MASQTLVKNEAEIREVLEKYAQAVRKKDINTLKSCYVDNLEAFDLLPPLRYKGTSSYIKLWEECFSMMEGPIRYETRDLSLYASDEIAFCHSLNQMGGDMKNEPTPGPDFIWFRATLGLRKINGQWLIVHEHTSAPVDMENGKACMDLKPE